MHGRAFDYDVHMQCGEVGLRQVPGVRESDHFGERTVRLW